MLLHDREFDIPVVAGHRGLLAHIRNALTSRFSAGVVPVRFVITQTTPRHYHCELGVISEFDATAYPTPDSIFRFTPRLFENQDRFNAVLVIPTGVGCEIGGHAGDATPVARLLGSVCDKLITHPNVVNASDLNEMPDNTLYVEGSVLTRLLMGTVGLSHARSNRVLVVIDDHEDPCMEDTSPIFKHNAINAVNGARASAGLRCDQIVTLQPRMSMETKYSSSGRASGQIRGVDRLCQIMDDYAASYDAVAITTVVKVEEGLQNKYFDGLLKDDCDGPQKDNLDDSNDIVNPWGGIEALLTHTLSSLYDVPTAHSPMYENQEIMNEDAGIMEPRVAAEGVSVAFLHCILRGLDRSPRIVSDADAMRRPGVITAEDVSCLVIPDGCIGLPTLAALEQGIPVIAVRNRNVMKNSLTDLPWATDQFHEAANYLEAAGIMNAIKCGISPCAVKRPIKYATVDKLPTNATVECNADRGAL